MPIYRNKYKYQLIYPVVGTCAYQSTSLKKGAKKCYEELKSLSNINTPYFTVLNLDTYETYKFQLDAENFSKINNDNLQDTVNNLSSRVQKLEHSLEAIALRSGRQFEGRQFEGRQFEGRQFEGRQFEGQFEGGNNDNINKNDKIIDKLGALGKLDKLDKVDKVDKIDKIGGSNDKIIGSDNLFANVLSKDMQNFNIKKVHTKILLDQGIQNKDIIQQNLQNDKEGTCSIM